MTSAALLLVGIIAQLLPGLWFPEQPVPYRGLTEGDAISFSIPLDEKLPAGTYVQFGVTLENDGDKAPRHYMVEVQEGKGWTTVGSTYNDGLAAYSFVTATTADRHPSSFLKIFRLNHSVSDSLTVRCRVCSSIAADRSVLSGDDPANCVSIKNMPYVGAKLEVLGRKAPVARKKVLMIGNSFTYFFSVPLMLQKIAFSQGLELDIVASLKGGQTFRDHTGLVLSLSSCSLQTYDYAFLQGQSQEPARFAEDRMENRDVKLALCDLCDAIRLTSPDCAIFVENTWAYGGGDFGGFGSMERFDALLAEGSAALAFAARCGTVPVGPAFAASRADNPELSLYLSDDKHQSPAGAYLKACVEYLLISGKPFKGDVPGCTTLSDADAAYLRSIAEKTVLK